MPTIKILEEEIRYDEAEVQELSRCDFAYKIGSVKRTDEGYLKGEAAIAKVGIMKYQLADGSIRSEFVPSETLFNVDSMNSLKLQPITNTHPEEVLLDSKTVKRRRVGTTGETVKYEGEFLITSVAITDDDAISNIESGRQQLSPGYKCLVVKKDGFYKGEKYDAIQIKRTYNHLAICDKARGGGDLRLNLDAIELSKLDGFEIIENLTKKEQNMPKFRIDGIDYDAAQEVINHISKLQANVDSAKAEAKVASDKAETLQANVDSQKEKLDSLEKRDLKSEIATGVKNRLALVKTAEAVLDAETIGKIDSMSDADVKKAIILAKSPEAKLDGKSEIYIEARFDSIVEDLSFDPEAISHQRKVSGKREDGVSIDSVEKARLDAETRIKDGWQNFGKDSK
jgi:hypothetical protein